MIKTKVCGMRDSSNIREVADAGPDYMGFIFHPTSKRFIGYKPDPSFYDVVPQQIIKTGVFVDGSYDLIKEITGKFLLGAVQLHGNETPQFCESLRKEDLLVIKTFHVDPVFNFDVCRPYMHSCDYFLFDTKSETHGGSGLKYDWKIFEDYRLDKPFFLSGGIGIDDIQSIKSLKNEQLYAVDVNSKFEVSPGIKDASKVRIFIEGMNRRL